MSKRKNAISSAATSAAGSTGSETLPQDGSALTNTGTATTPADENGSAGINTAASGGGAAGSELSGSEGPQGDDQAKGPVTEPGSEVSASASETFFHDDLKGFAGFNEALAMTGCTDFDDLVDMAKVGRSLMERIGYHVQLEGPLKDWSPADDPAEVVGDLVDMVEELQAKLDAAKATARGTFDPTAGVAEKRKFRALGRITHDGETVEPGGGVSITETQHKALAAAGVVDPDWDEGF